MFNTKNPRLYFDNFKKIFFPHLYMVQEEPDDFEEKIAANFRTQVRDNFSQQHVILEKRLLALE